MTGRADGKESGRLTSVAALPAHNDHRSSRNCLESILLPVAGEEEPGSSGLSDPCLTPWHPSLASILRWNVLNL